VRRSRKRVRWQSSPVCEHGPSFAFGASALAGVRILGASRPEAFTRNGPRAGWAFLVKPEQAFPSLAWNSLLSASKTRHRGHRDGEDCMTDDIPDTRDLLLPRATQQIIHLLKNLGLMGAMLLIMGSGPGVGSLDGRKTVDPMLGTARKISCAWDG
jgi:hypothetical protein